MLTALLNPRVIIIALIAIVMGFMLFKIQILKTKVATLEGDIAVKEQTIATLDGQLSSMQAMIDKLKMNLESARKSIREMQTIKDEANSLRRKLIELQNEPTACEALKVEYEKIAMDITVMFNDRVRGKVNRSDSDSSRAATEVLPNAGKTNPDEPKVDAGVAR